MSSSAAKKDDSAASFPDSVELSIPASTDREQGLSQNFQDPSLDDLIPSLVQPSEGPAALSVVHETVEAVQELLGEAQTANGLEAQPESGSAAIDLSQSFGDLNLSLVPEAAAAAPPSLPAAPEKSDPAEPEPLVFLSAGERTDMISFDPDPVPGVASHAPADSVEKDTAQFLDLGSGSETTRSAPADSVEQEPSMMISMAGGATETNGAPAQWEMAEKLFQLVVCELSFDDLVESGLTTIMGALGAQAGAVLEQDTEKNNYFFRTSVGGGDPEKVKAFRVPLGKGIVGHVGESRQAILLRDLDEDQKQMRAISMSVGFEAKTCMAAPIVVGGQLYGVIELFNRRQGGFFSEHDLQLLQDGTRMLAKVLEVRFLMAELIGRGE